MGGGALGVPPQDDARRSQRRPVAPREVKPRSRTQARVAMPGVAPRDVNGSCGEAAATRDTGRAGMQRVMRDTAGLVAQRSDVAAQRGARAMRMALVS